MKLKDCKITMLLSADGLSIEIKDSGSNITFFRGLVSPENTCAAFGRLSSVEMSAAETYGLDKVGKTMEHKKFEFVMPPSEWKTKKQIASIAATDQRPDGWEPDLYFGSQDSFFMKDGVEHARCTIRRWV